MERYRDAPAWRSFVPRSAAITAELADALSAWEAQMAVEELRLIAITPPGNPVV